MSQYRGVGGLAVLGGVACCVGLKLIGGAILFSGLAATTGLTTGQTTFVVGGGGASREQSLFPDVTSQSCFRLERVAAHVARVFRGGRRGLASTRGHL